MGRPREFDTGEALEKAMKAFWANGYEGTSIQDLMTATGLQKQSLYSAFGNKRDIYIACLKHFDETRLRGSIALSFLLIPVRISSGLKPLVVIARKTSETGIAPSAASRPWPVKSPVRK